MTDVEHPAIRYGTPNWELMARWMKLAPAEDGPFWALNLMRYREQAEYADGRETTLSGREADDTYAPLGPLAAIGAVPAFLGEVTDQPSGTPSWDRVGIVRYPSRAAFFAMQQREDFRELHAHKDAGMEFTIVMSCLPSQGTPADQRGAAEQDGELVVTVQRLQASAQARSPAQPAVLALARFEVEGVIVGDERSWTEARFDVVGDEHGYEAVKAAAAAAQEAVVMKVQPAFDNLIGSMLAEPAPAGARGT